MLRNFFNKRETVGKYLKAYSGTGKDYLIMKDTSSNVLYSNPFYDCDSMPDELKKKKIKEIEKYPMPLTSYCNIILIVDDEGK